MENKAELKRVMKKLYGHSEVSVRKNVVLFYVQGYYFFKKEEFAELISQFSVEQQKLIEIYVEKSKTN